MSYHLELTTVDILSGPSSFDAKRVSTPAAELRSGSTERRRTVRHTAGEVGRSNSGMEGKVPPPYIHITAVPEDAQSNGQPGNDEEHHRIPGLPGVDHTGDVSMTTALAHNTPATPVDSESSGESGHADPVCRGQDASAAAGNLCLDNSGGGSWTQTMATGLTRRQHRDPSVSDGFEESGSSRFRSNGPRESSLRVDGTTTPIRPSKRKRTSQNAAGELAHQAVSSLRLLGDVVALREHAEPRSAGAVPSTGQHDVATVNHVDSPLDESHGEL